MEMDLTNYDKDVFEEELGAWIDMLGAGGEYGDSQITPEEQYRFSMNNGKEMLVKKFKIEGKVGENDPYSDLWFFLAEVEGKVAGYSTLALMRDVGGQVRMAGGYLGVSEKSIGIGGNLSRLRDLELQKIANEKGDVDYVVMSDENAEKINRTLGELDRKWMRGDAPNYREQVERMMIDRQKWLRLFGEGGKMGYKWDEDKEFLYKRYRKGEPVPDIGCRTEKHDTDLRVEIVK